MPAYIQTARPLRLTTPLGPDALLLVALAGHEAISRLFHFRLDALAQNETDVPFEQLLGRKVTVELGLPDQEVRYFSGICCRVGQGGRDQTFTAYHLEVVPQLWFLTRIAQSRIFQQLNVPEILAQVLKGLDVQFQLAGRYEPRDYCVQYRETDFNFASRLMEEEGIFYFFRHADRGHTLIVADSPQSFPELPQPLIFDEAFTSGHRDEERLGSWQKTQELRSGKVTLWDHSFELPHKHLESQKLIQDSVAAGTVTHPLKIQGSDKLELYDYPGEYAQRFDGVNPGGGDRAGDLQKIAPDGSRTAGLRMQEEAAAGLVIRGAGNVRALASGSRFTLQRHFDADGSYLLTAVEHTARQAADYRSGDPDPYHYAASFHCLPAALPFRPQRSTPRPVVQGTQTAVVVGPPGEEIFTDQYGRVKVQFHWDRQGQGDAHSSCWIRVGQVWAGRRWGASFWPRIGQEVIVAFEEGDPDQPIVIGSVYNADQMPPYLGQGPDGKHPNDNQLTGVKSNSTKGGAGYNEWRFDDSAGREQFFLHAQRNMDVRVLNDSLERIFGNRHLVVGWEQDGRKGGDQREEVKRDKHLHVHRNQAEHIGGDMLLLVGGGDGPGNQDIVIKKDKKELIEGESHLHVKQGRNEQVDGTQSLTVGGDQQEKVGQKHALEAGQEIHLKAGMKVILEAGVQLTIKGPGGFVDINPSGVTIQGTMVLINSGGSAGSGSGSSPAPPQDPKPASPTTPGLADDAKPGMKSTGITPPPPAPAPPFVPPVAPTPETTKTKDPHASSKTNGNRIDIDFDPDKSEKVTQCEKIVHVQFIKLHVNGKVAKPGDFLAAWKYRDKVVTDDGWWIDHLAHEKTPDYQQGNGEGKKNGGKAVATMDDSPSIGNDTIQGAYDPKTNPGGWKTVRYEFATYAYCMKGDDCGKWYEGLTWEYNKTWEEHRDGKKGESKITDKNATTGPSASQVAAFDKFNKEKGFTPCK